MYTNSALRQGVVSFKHLLGICIFLIIVIYKCMPFIRTVMDIIIRNTRSLFNYIVVKLIIDHAYCMFFIKSHNSSYDISLSSFKSLRLSAMLILNYYVV